MSRRGIARLAVHLLPAAVAAALVLNIVTGVVGGVAAVAVALFAPGWLLWKLLPPMVDHDPPALPALWTVLSFTVLTPAIAGLTFFGLSVTALEAYLVGALGVLGVLAGRAAAPRVEPWTGVGYGLGATMLGAVFYRLLTWHDSDDDLSYLGFMHRIAENGEFPEVNPFLAGDLPLAQRWSLDGWTGLSGALAHLGNAKPVNIYMDILPAVLVLVGASALYVLARTLSGDRRFAHFAAFAALLVPLLTSVTAGQGRKTEFKYFYRSIAQNKYAALIIFLPVVAALLIAAYRSRHKVAAVAAALTLWAMIFVHPVPAVLTVSAFGLFVLLDLVVNRPGGAAKAIGFSAVMLIPLVATAVAVSFSGERFGTRLGDADEVSDIAFVAYDWGPVEILEPRRPKLATAGPEDAAVVFIGGHAINQGPRIVMLANGLPLAHWRMLGNPSNLVVVLAIVLMMIGRHRDPVALWIVAASVVAVSVFVLPPVAALVARFITPWNLWRFSWLLPVPLATAWLVAHWLPRARWPVWGSAGIAALLTVVFVASTHGAVLRTGPTRAEARTAAAVAELDGFAGVLLGEGRTKEWAISNYSELDAVSYRGMATMSNGFPSDRRTEALARFQDARGFFKKATSTADRLAILERNDVDFVLIAKDKRGRFDLEALGLEKLIDVGRDEVLYKRAAS